MVQKRLNDFIPLSPLSSQAKFSVLAQLGLGKDNRG